MCSKNNTDMYRIHASFLSSESSFEDVDYPSDGSNSDDDYCSCSFDEIGSDDINKAIIQGNLVQMNECDSEVLVNQTEVGDDEESSGTFDKEVFVTDGHSVYVSGEELLKDEDEDEGINTSDSILTHQTNVETTVILILKSTGVFSSNSKDRSQIVFDLIEFNRKVKDNIKSLFGWLEEDSELYETVLLDVFRKTYHELEIEEARFIAGDSLNSKDLTNDLIQYFMKTSALRFVHTTLEYLKHNLKYDYSNASYGTARAHTQKFKILIELLIERHHWKVSEIEQMVLFHSTIKGDFKALNKVLSVDKIEDAYEVFEKFVMFNKSKPKRKLKGDVVSKLDKRHTGGGHDDRSKNGKGQEVNHDKGKSSNTKGKSQPKTKIKYQDGNGNPRCFNCGRWGHIRVDCYLNKKNRKW